MEDEINYNDLCLLELIDLIEERFEIKVDKRKKKEYIIWKDDVNSLISLINSQSGIKIYNKIK